MPIVNAVVKTGAGSTPTSAVRVRREGKKGHVEGTRTVNVIVNKIRRVSTASGKTKNGVSNIRISAVHRRAREVLRGAGNN
jgi:hypothetical protein